IAGRAATRVSMCPRSVRAAIGSRVAVRRAWRDQRMSAIVHEPELAQNGFVGNTDPRIKLAFGLFKLPRECFVVIVVEQIGVYGIVHHRVYTSECRRFIVSTAADKFF